MAIEVITVPQYTCERCSHVWLPKRPDSVMPKTCANAKCRSPYWDTPRRVNPSDTVGTTHTEQLSGGD